jgi:hypothetical protein
LSCWDFVLYSEELSVVTAARTEEEALESLADLYFTKKMRPHEACRNETTERKFNSNRNTPTVVLVK